MTILYWRTVYVDHHEEAKSPLIDQNEGTDVGGIPTVFNISDDHYVNVLTKLWRVQDDVKIKANYSLGTPARDIRWIRSLQRAGDDFHRRK